MKSLAIAATNIRRLMRDRSNIFFVLILPLGIIIIIGSLFGGSFNPIIGLNNEADTPLASQLAQAFGREDGFDIRVFDSEDDMVRAVERGDADAGVLIPADYDSIIRGGNTAVVGFVARQGGSGQELQAAVTAIVGRQAELTRAARFASETVGMDFGEALSSASALSSGIPEVSVETEFLGQAIFGESPGQFDYGAATQLVAFMFLTGLVGASALIQTRNFGVSRRMLSTPTSMRSIVVGEALGRFGVSIVQGLYIVFVSWLMFRVNWGDPIGAGAIVVLFAATAAGAATLIGSIFDNDQQVGGFGVVAGLGLAALGGAMIPLEFFNDTMRTAANFTPHAWALDAFAELVRRDANVIDILPQLGVLAVFAVVLLALAAWRLRVAITRP